jgi:quinol monooxygenase YgiN
MAIGVVFEVPGVTQAQYEQVNQQVTPAGQMPGGLLHHFAGPTPNGWCVVEIWESEEAAQRFVNEKLTQAIQQAGIPNEPPKVTFQVYRTMPR